MTDGPDGLDKALADHLQQEEQARQAQDLYTAQASELLAEVITLADEMSIPVPASMRDPREDEEGAGGQVEHAMASYLTTLVGERLEATYRGPQPFYGSEELTILLGTAPDDEAARSIVRLTNRYLEGVIDPLDEEELLTDRVAKAVMQQAIETATEESQVIRLQVRTGLRDLVGRQFGWRDETEGLVHKLFLMADNVAAVCQVQDSNAEDARLADLERLNGMLYNVLDLAGFEGYIPREQMNELVFDTAEVLLTAVEELGYIPQPYHE